MDIIKYDDKIRTRRGAAISYENSDISLLSISHRARIFRQWACWEHLIFSSELVRKITCRKKASKLPGRSLTSRLHCGKLSIKWVMDGCAV